MTTPKYPEYLSEQFAKDVSEHRLEVRNDNGLYRHLRCMKPDSSNYWFDVVTWPGALAITGDFGEGFTFRRLPDMFAFFRTPFGRINPGYWSEKIVDGRERASEYSEHTFREYVEEVVREYGEDDPDGVDKLRKKIDEEIFDEDSWFAPDLSCEDEARQALRDFAHDCFHGFDGAWEQDFRDWDPRFLWACHAIVWAIQQYDTQTSKSPA